MTTLTVHEISKTLGGSAVLDNVSLVIPTGTRTALVGASGSGKTTLLRLIAGFSRPDRGTIALDDTVVSGRDVFLPAHRRGVGYVPQDGALFPHLTVEQNIRFGLRHAQRGSTRIAEVAELVALPLELLRRFPHEISGGQQQRVAVARALAPAPKMIVLDEPFSALDTSLREHSRLAVIAALEASDATAVLVTHDQDEALMFGHQIGVLADGLLLQHGHPSAVFDKPVTAEVAAFLGDAVFLTARIDDSTAITAFGAVAIRHRASVAGSRVMLRPEQLSVRTDGAANGVVRAIRPRGASSYIEIEALGGGERVTVSVFAAESECRVGDEVSVVIRGTVVSY
ncbi:ABC transporter ATP-binding protein [Luethyella okanaganae]|uniref:ABC transporter ATP-binding protein n=1 Tax=Luethyella okanaganae TaxID=69372 RepID=A0ABW1VDQ6_9MICO